MRIVRGTLLTVVMLGAGIGGTAMALLVGQTAGAATTSSPSVLVGDTSVEPTESSLAPGLARAWQYQASASGTSATESLYVPGDVNASPRVVLGLYADATGAPGALLGSGAVTVTPDASTLDAIALMRRYKIGCLPVVQGEHIVAVITEEDFLGIASKIISEEEQKATIDLGVNQ